MTKLLPWCCTSAVKAYPCHNTRIALVLLDQKPKLPVELHLDSVGIKRRCERHRRANFRRVAEADRRSS
jgi:hypothetical protein